jgi:hypothetical protein
MCGLRNVFHFPKVEFNTVDTLKMLKHMVLSCLWVLDLDWWLDSLITLTHDLWLHFTDHCYTHSSVLSLLQSPVFHCLVMDPTDRDSSSCMLTSLLSCECLATELFVTNHFASIDWTVLSRPGVLAYSLGADYTENSLQQSLLWAVA